MSTSQDCSHFVISEKAVRSHCTQQNHIKLETRAKAFLKSRHMLPTQYCLLQNTQDFKVFLTGLCGPIVEQIRSRQLLTFLNSL